MAEKHKSKYKKPENTKYKTRKDLKDYTADDKKGGLNPNSTGEKQSNVLRKTDKETVDTGDMYVKYNADDRLYKDVEDGEYDPKHAAKVLKKRQDAGEKASEKNLKDKVYNLTREQKERLVREYIRRKITKVILEAEGDVDPAAEEDPLAATDATAAPMPDAAAAPTDMPAPDPTAATPATPAPAAEPTPAEPAEPAVDVPVEEKQAIYTQKYIDSIKQDGTINQVNSILRVSNNLTKEIATGDKIEFYGLLMKKARETYLKLTGSK